MKGEGLKTLKIYTQLHRALKTYCASKGEPLQDFVINTLNSALPPAYQVDFAKKKKK